MSVVVQHTYDDEDHETDEFLDKKSVSVHMLHSRRKCRFQTHVPWSNLFFWAVFVILLTSLFHAYVRVNALEAYIKRVEFVYEQKHERLQNTCIHCFNRTEL